MISGKPGGVGRQLETLWTSGTLTGLSDAQLLRRFTQRQDAAGRLALGELVERHGPMVLGVCRQILRDAHQADDAFQATFLILVRKADSIRLGESLTPWLYSVACRTARRARAVAARERPATEEEIHSLAAAADEAYTLDLRPLLHEEVSRLPEKYWDPIVLCHIEGRTHEEAARLLSWPVGTLSGRLSRARKLLRSRLERRGVTVPAALFSTAWLLHGSSAEAVPLFESTLVAASRSAAAALASATAPASVVSLTHGVLRTMFLRKLSIAAFAVLVLGAVSGGAVVWANLSSTPARGPVPAGAPAASSTRTPEASPTPAPNDRKSIAPQAQPRDSADSRSVAADDCPSECPLTGAARSSSDCPITRTAHAISRMFGHLTAWSVASK
jgi:RNA polymerase sigma factor (sigma-70 family)